MVKALVSYLTLSALVVVATNSLLNGAFTPKRSELSLQKLTTQSFSRTSTPVAIDYEVVELSENDFIPSFEDNVASKPKDASLKYLQLKKVVSFKGMTNTGITGERLLINNKVLSINGQEPVQLYGINDYKVIKVQNLAKNFESIKFEKINSLALVAASKTKEIKEIFKNTVDKSSSISSDRISTALAATEKSPEVSGLKNIDDGTASNEGLVFFDYSKPVPTKKVESKTSIKSLGAKAKTVDTNKNEILKRVLEGMGKKVKSSNQKIADNTQSENTEIPENEERFGFASRVNSQNYKSSLRVTTHGHSLTKGTSNPITEFDIRFLDNPDDIVQSSSDGSALINTLLNSDYSIRRATILSSGFLPTAVDLVLESEEINLSMPLLSMSSFNQVLEKYKLRGLGAHALIELDELTEDVDFDVSTSYEGKLYLDRNMRIVNRAESEYAYVLFIGVDSGNRIISFKTYKNEVTSKIVHLVEDELYFDFNFYYKTKKDRFSLFEDNLLSKESAVLSVDEDQIVDLSFDSKINKKTVNTFEVSRAIYPVGSRKYYELKHQRDSIFIGRWGSKSVNVPSEGYKRFAMNSFGVDSLSGQCMVQINLSKQAKSLSFNGSSYRGPMVVEEKILDSDGVFYSDLSNQSKRIFLMGQEQGSINIAITYVDNSRDYLQSFCSQSNYLVEQL